MTKQEFLDLLPQKYRVRAQYRLHENTVLTDASDFFLSIMSLSDDVEEKLLWSTLAMCHETGVLKEFLRTETTLVDRLNDYHAVVMRSMIDRLDSEKN